MKKIIVLFSIVIVACISCNKNNNTNSDNAIVISDTAIYSIKIKCTENIHWSDYFYSNLETSKHKYFISSLFEGIKAGSTNIYDYKTWDKISLENAKKIGTTFDTVEMPDSINPDKMNLVVVENPLDIEKISSMIFKEVWTFNTKTKAITKEIISFCPSIDVFFRNPSTDELEVKAQQPLFWVKNNNKCGKESKEIAENIVTSVCPTSELAINKLPMNIIKAISKNAFEQAAKDTNNIYNSLTLEEKLSYTELKERLVEENSITTVSQLDPSDESTTVEKRNITPENIDFLSFSEQWTYDAINNCLCKKINSIGFGYSVYYTNEMGEKALKGYKILFVLKM
ncbi:MAG: hypothetical protein WCK02_15570 [Bacteroidota bacterium]